MALTGALTQHTEKDSRPGAEVHSLLLLDGRGNV